MGRNLYSLASLAAITLIASMADHWFSGSLTITANDSTPPLTRDTLPASEVTASRLPVFTRNRPLSGPVTIRFLAVPTRPGMDSPSAAAVAMPAVRLRSCIRSAWSR